MKTTPRTTLLALTGLLGGTGWLLAAPALDNGRIRAEFDDRGLVALHDPGARRTVRLAEDGFAVVASDVAFDSVFQTPTVEPGTDTRRVYRYDSGDWHVRVTYEIQPGCHFITKQISIERTAARDGARRDFRVHRIDLLRGRLTEKPAGQRTVRSGGLLRFPAEASATGHGMFVIAQNPLSQWRTSEDRVSIGYSPEMKAGGEPFVSDRLCLGLYQLSGIEFPQRMLPEWQYLPDATPRGGPTVDVAEVDALVECARAFLVYHPKQSIRVHIGWCENDYQIDIGTPEGRAEYKRILDQASAVGCQYVLFTPGNNALAPLSENRDAWGWENVLWFGLGQKIRKDEWDPNKDSIPESVQELLDYAKGRGLKPLAYAYPSMPFLQQKEWTSWVPNGRPGGYLGADTGQRSFQDWWLNKLEDFSRKTGAAGYSFDHWWIAYDDTPSSKYQQWAGCRRILEELRRRLPEAVIDGRQQYHGFGVWTWLAGSYPHPLASDEQPESFRSFPDLHWDRGSAARQRRTSWWFRMEHSAPVEILPGYLTHQTGRNNEKGECVRTRFRPRDWDYLGWRYSVISAIATAPFNLVVNFLPARDEEEFKHFPAADQRWMRDWFDWTDQNLETLRHVKPILGEPQLGRVDGTAAFKDGRGFIFLFNPNYRPLAATFKLDHSIGLAVGERFTIRQLYPESEKGRLFAPEGQTFWKRGDQVEMPMPGTEALVLQVEPAPDVPAQPILLGAAGRAELRGGQLALSDVVGEAGTERTLTVALSDRTEVRSLTVNGLTTPFGQAGALVTARVRFAGEPFARCQQVGEYDARFSGTNYQATIAVPARVFQQLEARRRAWPITYTEDDLRAAYLAPHRLLLFINIAEPDDERMKVSLKVDGRTVEVMPAYTSILRSNPRNTFVGWFADLSSLPPDVRHTFELELPALAPGQFQGLFFDTVEAEFTKEVAATR